MITIILIFIIFTFFILELVYPKSIYLLSFIPSLAFSEPYRFITSLFLHADFFHLFFNCWALFLFGIEIERIIGKLRFLMVFFVSGIVGNILYMFLSTENIPAIGASGAIFGIIGTLAILRPSLSLFIFPILVPIPIIIFAIIYGLYEAIMSFTHLYESTSIASPAHFGGLIFGIIYGILLRKQRKRKRYLVIWY
mgnify:CR=1 FL=1